jgi:hypothetical protein
MVRFQAFPAREIASLRLTMIFKLIFLTNCPINVYAESNHLQGTKVNDLMNKRSKLLYTNLIM